MATEWRSNLWLIIELLIISCIIWYILDFCGIYLRQLADPVGLDIEHVYEVEIGIKTPDSPGYVQHSGEGDDTDYADLLALRDRLKVRPDIEAVASGSSRPYNFNFWGIRTRLQPVGSDSIYDWVNEEGSRINRFKVNPDYMRIFLTRGIRGETPDQLTKVLEERKAIVTTNYAKMGPVKMSPEELYNARLYYDSEDSSKFYEIGAVIPPIKRADFEPAYHATVITRMKKPDIRFYLRVKDEQDNGFADRLLDDHKTIDVGNAFLRRVQPMEQIRTDLHRDDWAMIRNLFICMGFMLVIVFLGLLGTFWFRTQQRVNELAIRKVNGATKGQIFRRLIGEGLLLLAVVTPVAFGVDCLMIHYDLSFSHQFFEDGQKWVVAAVQAVIAAALIAIMIVAGIYFPARKAVNIEPADVLRGE